MYNDNMDAQPGHWCYQLSNFDGECELFTEM